jgi:hypothetical protein
VICAPSHTEECASNLLCLREETYQRYPDDQCGQAHNQDRVSVSDAPASGKETGKKDQYRKSATYENENVPERRQTEVY